MNDLVLLQFPTWHAFALQVEPSKKYASVYMINMVKYNEVRIVS